MKLCVMMHSVKMHRSVRGASFRRTAAIVNRDCINPANFMYRFCIEER